ncbi:MAG TPA: CusA/CzcA family heavy metal efflux RND transporter [Blastocatellia bacterium]|nr:CusA/CzcA family heavy metal efflux RND transporter [Blastocatellia bacterium]
MIRALIEFSLRQRLLVLALTLLLAGAGVYAFTSLSIDAFPDLTNNQVNIVTEARGMAAAEVEQLITYPIESAMMGIRGAEEVRSISKFGLSIITIVFSDSVDTYFARQMVGERLQEAKTRIPEGMQPTLGPVATAFGEIYQYVIEGKDHGAMELKTLHDWMIKPQLRSVPGVNEINSWGGFIQQYHVLVEPERLIAYNLTLRDVYHALSMSNSNFGGSYIERGSEGYTVRGLGRFDGEQAEEQIRQVVIKSSAGAPVLVKDVATVEVGPAVRQGAVTKDGLGEVVSGMVIMTKGENSKAVIERVSDRVSKIEKTLPAGVKLTPFYQQTTLVDRTIRTVATNLIEGGLLVIVVLFLFLYNIRASLIVASVIPLSMLVAFIGMKAFGVTANLMSLGAVDFGLMVDGAVVMIENFTSRLNEEGVKTREEAVRIVRGSAVEVARPIGFGVLIIIAVYLPIFALQGLEARMFRPMALTVCCALLGALVLTMTFAPAIASLALKPHHHEGHERILTALQNRYRRLLSGLMRNRWLTIGVALIVVSIAIGSIKFLGTEFMPQLDEGALLIETRRLPSISLTQSVEIASMVEKVVREFPEVETVVTKIGRPDLATEAMGVYQGDVYVILKPKEQWTTVRTKEELIEKLDEKLKDVPGVVYNFTQPLAMRLDEVISGVKADVAVKLFGDDQATLEREAREIEGILGRVRGVADLQTEALGGAGELQIAVNRAEMARYGLRVEDVKELIETAIGGGVATEVIDGRRRFDVVVRLPEARRKEIETIRALLVPAPGGERVTLGQVADIRTAEGPEVINREDAQRRIVIQSNVRGRDIGSFVAEARALIEREVKLPAGYYITWGGEFENTQRAMKRLYIVVPLALLLIFLLLYSTFNSLRYAALIIANVPFALVGGIAAVWLRGFNLSLSTAVGFIALFGVAVLNGVVMVSHINSLRKKESKLRETILEGAVARLRPVLMTALVASLGFVPMALSTAPGAEVQRPLATVVIGGLITSTLLTLFVLPTLYELIAKKPAPEPEFVAVGE